MMLRLSHLHVRQKGFWFSLLCPAFALLLLMGCKDNTQTLYLSYEEQLAIDRGIIDKYLADKGITAEVTPAGLYYQVLTPGTGPAGATGKIVKVNYIGKSLTGYKFDSTYDTGVPFSFVVGTPSDTRSSHKWWHEALPLMQQGAEFRFFVPSGMAYGRAGTQTIPANAILTYDLKLVEVR